MTKISWLHISDMHISRPGGDYTVVNANNQEKVLGAFLDYIERELPGELSKRGMDFPGLLFVTGDLAFAGTKQDYNGPRRANATNSVNGFLKDLCRRMNISADDTAKRVFFVAGNHDVCRGDGFLDDKHAEKAHLDRAKNRDEVDELLVSNELPHRDTRRQILKRLDPYCKFYREFKGLPGKTSRESILWYAEPLSWVKAPKPVHVVGLCSSWLCHSRWRVEQKDDPAKVNLEEEVSHLPLGALKTEKLLDAVPEDAICIALVHHNCVKIIADDALEHIHDKCNLLLSGHAHKEKMWGKPLGGKTHHLQAGSLYEDKEYNNAFNVVELDLESNKCKHVRIEWHQSEARWQLDVYADPTKGYFDPSYRPIGEGVVEFDLMPPLLTNLNQIGEPVTDFVGREVEIAAVVAAFDGRGKGGAVISGLHGMGGVGKTELAKVVAKRLKDRFPGGQIAFNLRGARDDASSKPATAAEAMAHVIQSFHRDARLPEELDQLQGLYHSVLDGKRVLLLMDNALNARQLTPLVPPPDGCALMVTARHSISLAGMKTVDLNMLSPEEAQKLLIEICPRIGEQADVLAGWCGYLPLALRLAASALETHRALQVKDYIEHLGNEQGRLAELDKYQKTVGVDHGIRASLATSYNLLETAEQRLWRALAVFPAEFDTPAAGAVWQLEDGQAAAALARLHAASMVQWEPSSGRFRLHDLARDYALGRLSNKERARDAQRHAAHYAALLRRANALYLEGADAVLKGLALFDLERANICAGQAWASAHLDSNQTAAALCSDYPDAGASFLDLRLRSREQIAWLEAAVQAARKLKDREGEGNHLGNLGLAYADLGEMRKAIEFYEQVLAIAREIGDRCSEGASFGNLGNVYADFGETRKAIEFYEQQLVIVREIGDWRGEGNALGNLGITYAALGETRKAIEFYEQRLEIAREIGDRRGEGNALGNLGIAYGALGDTRKAIEFYEQQLVIVREIGYRRGEGSALGNLGTAYAALGETRKAIEFYEQHLEIVREIGYRRGEAIACHNLAGELAKMGRRDEAVAHAEEAVKIFDAIESPYAANARAQLEQLRR